MSMSISFSIIVVPNPKTGVYIGFVKEISGVVVQGKTKKEVFDKMPTAINAILRAKAKLNESKTDQFIDHGSVTELEFALAS